MSQELPGNLTGTMHVRALRAAFHDAHHWLPRMRDRAILRRHSLKLRFWPEKHPEDDNGLILDLDWEWIKALRKKNKKIGELRINETIGDHDNLRVIFFKPDILKPHPMIWILSVFQKKRQDFTRAQLQTFEDRSAIVLERFYDEHS